MIGILDYGAGNLTSVRKAFRAVGVDPVVVSDAGDIDGCEGVVVPGVGHFGATRAIDEGARQAILRRVESGVPLLGICLGMQWLFDGSVEAPNDPGLGLMRGRCERLRIERPLKVPHVGWNALAVKRSTAILDGIQNETHVYFTHSFAAAVTEDCAAMAVHGEPFAAAVERDHVCGVQFHPEKSGDAGLRILRNFVRMTRR